MYGREKLEYYIVSDEDIYEEEVYLKNQADKVMDAMERRIARLTALVEGWKRNSVELGDMYHKRLEDVQNTMATENADLRIENHKLRECNEEREEQIKELEVVKEGHEEGITWLKERIKALESIPHTDNTAVIEALQKRIKKLEAAISKMETTTPKWISVKDRLPNEKEQNELLWVGWVRNDNTIKYIYEALFDSETKQFYTENDWGNKDYFVAPSIWMVVPPLPTTEVM